LPIAGRIAARDFPSIFQAWSPADNLPNKDRLAVMAMHDLVWHGPGGFGLNWDTRPQGLAEAFTPESIEASGSMGVEWITDWPGTGDDRANWYYSATYLYNELKGNAGWYGAFNWGEKNAWERDFKAFANGGNGLIDSVDLALIGSHGTTAWDTRYGKELTAVSFTSNKDDTALSPGEAYRAYGTYNLEWLAGVS